MDKTRVAVLRGGPSEEYDVSLKSGASVLSALDRNHFEPLDIVITRDGEWLQDGYIRYPEDILPTIDVVFLALHGSYGEDGTVQRLLDTHGVRYTGSKALPSRIAINKALTKDHLKGTGIKMSPHMVVTRDSSRQLHTITTNIGDLFGPEYVVKPLSSGSSVGTRMVPNKGLLPRALREALDENEVVIIEKRIKGKEATCGVIEHFRGEALYALPPIEIVPPPHADFFDHTVKYDDSTEEICPGRFHKDTKQEIERIAKLVHHTLGLSQYSRSDFMIGEDGLYFLEVNTLPGMTAESLFPKAVHAVGETYTGFLTHLLTDALQ